ncbi:MAG: tRNA pseudouridine(38-40) synthase TruA [Anaerolineaceae bacterium]|nr:tRNA pseudouridine(38-40) synthase TruA [Anaerolineaceae bacterium]
MARYQIILAYDGTDFFGFQRQGKTRTVQLVLETALASLGWQGRSILAAGRTDTGVHAWGQVASFELDWHHSSDALKSALNANLPDDVAVRDVCEAHEEFHPRFNALSRTYQYSIYCQPQREPLLQRYAWQVWPAVEILCLQQAASLFPGTHDFSAFGNPPRPNGSTVRTVYRAEWKEQNGCLRFEVSADAFLYHMVRRMVYLQVMAAKRKISLEGLEQAIREARRQMPGLAPAHGLVLAAVAYDISKMV